MDKSTHPFAVPIVFSNTVLSGVYSILLNTPRAVALTVAVRTRTNVGDRGRWENANVICMVQRRPCRRVRDKPTPFWSNT
jgi:hypothetical protein